ncbi:MAG: hypothetical protein OXG96_13575, partial [Acidobacteria bacterium]|nr:hypothetical protein [Acidobacteriota bacterium]
GKIRACYRIGSDGDFPDRSFGDHGPEIAVGKRMNLALEVTLNCEKEKNGKYRVRDRQLRPAIQSHWKIVLRS